MIKPSLQYSTKRRGNPRIHIPNPEAAFAFALAAILGDGSLKKEDRRLCIDQGVQDYTECKKKLGVELGIVSSDMKIAEVKRTRIDPTTGTTIQRSSWRFYTRSLFGQWHDPFYVYKSPRDPTFRPNEKPKRRKRFPSELVEWFNHPLALAIFYMDDGGVQDNQVYFSTGEVPLNEVQHLQKAFQINFGLDTSIRTSAGIPVGLLVRRKDCGMFLSHVTPYIGEIPCMRYKLNISP